MYSQPNTSTTLVHVHTGLIDKGDKKGERRRGRGKEGGSEVHMQVHMAWNRGESLVHEWCVSLEVSSVIQSTAKGLTMDSALGEASQ